MASTKNLNQEELKMSKKFLFDLIKSCMKLEIANPMEIHKDYILVFLADNSVAKISIKKVA